MHTHSSKPGFRRGVAIAILCLCATRASAQDLPLKRPHEIVGQIGAGGALSFYPDQTIPEEAGESRFGASVTARVLWRPGHLLGIGVQSGLTQVSSVQTSNVGTLRLSTMPATLVFAMETGGFDVSAAAGWQRYIVSSDARTISSTWEMSYVIAAGYSYPLGNAFGIGAELAFGALPERQMSTVALQLRGTYSFRLD
jgi:hypothetical protein